MLQLLFKANFQSHLLLHVNQCLGIAHRIVNWVMGVGCFSKMLEIGEHVFRHSFVERANVCRGKAEGIGS